MIKKKYEKEELSFSKEVHIKSVILGLLGMARAKGTWMEVFRNGRGFWYNYNL